MFTLLSGKTVSVDSASFIIQIGPYIVAVTQQTCFIGCYLVIDQFCTHEETSFVSLSCAARE